MCSQKLKVLLACFVVLASCQVKRKILNIEIERSLTTDVVSSGSGMVVYRDAVFIVGDDAEFVGTFGADGPYLPSRLNLYPGAPYTRIDRTVKHDLESCTLGLIGADTYLFAFGSGSISPHRDTLFVLDVPAARVTIKKSLSAFYAAIRARANMMSNQLNVEGAAKAAHKLILFNRGRNFLVSIPWIDFISFVQSSDSSAVPNFRLTDFSLPVINGYPIGFSGACALSENRILFTASLEETTDFTKDGAIKGSYIGILRLITDTTVTLEHMSIIKDEKGKLIFDKLESIEVISTKKNSISAIAVADNDDGTSKIFYLKLRQTKK